MGDKNTKRCPVCETDIPPSTIGCECGYHFEKEQVVEKDKIRAHLSKLVKSNQWAEEVELKKRINEVQHKRLRSSWSQTKTSELLEETKGLTSQDIKLAEALHQYPELLECKNKDRAKKRLIEIINEPVDKGTEETFDSEEAFQKYLESNWDKIPSFAEWSLQSTGVLEGGKYHTGEVGEMDLLARHRKEDRWLVIELKKDKSSDTTVGQILRYMGWVKANLVGENGKVEGLVISRSEDASIRYALHVTPNIKLMIYSLKNGELNLTDHIHVYLEKLPPGVRLQVLKNLRRKFDKSD